MLPPAPPLPRTPPSTSGSRVTISSTPRPDFTQTEEWVLRQLASRWHLQRRILVGAGGGLGTVGQQGKGAAQLCHSAAISSNLPKLMQIFSTTPQIFQPLFDQSFFGSFSSLCNLHLHTTILANLSYACDPVQ